MWLPSSNGEFSVSLAWEALHQCRNASLVDKFVWDSKIPLKISFFTWRLLHSWVSLDDVLQHMGVVLASKCCCYSNFWESPSYLFVVGLLAATVWLHCTRQFGILYFTSARVSSLLVSWFFSHSGVSTGHIRVLLHLEVLWVIWKG